MTTRQTRVDAHLGDDDSAPTVESRLLAQVHDALQRLERSIDDTRVDIGQRTVAHAPQAKKYLN
jgi:hypothetical protein